MKYAWMHGKNLVGGIFGQYKPTNITVSNDMIVYYVDTYIILTSSSSQIKTWDINDVVKQSAGIIADGARKGARSLTQTENSIMAILSQICPVGANRYPDSVVKYVLDRAEGEAKKILGVQ